jgi:tetratricopeptide (TPR) repeat protein
MCFWGVAFSVGANINKPMDDADVPVAWNAVQDARRLSSKASRRERDLIQALTVRYSKEPVKDRAPLDLAYADAMRVVARAHPDDLDIQTLFAEALMDTMPWAYYQKDGSPKPATVEVVDTLERVIVEAPMHPGALHFYIHAVEASATPERAEAPADRLGNLMPGAGHLVHMPSHVYIRVGRYHDASVANELAAKADESYLSQCHAQGFYPAMYYPHNIHFLWASASFEGRSAVALGAAQKMVAFIPSERVNEFPFLEELLPIVLLTQVRFGQWDEILAAAPPAAEHEYATSIWRYARGLALVRRGRLAEAERELKRLQATAESPEMASLKLLSVQTSAQQLLRIAAAVLEGELAASRRQWGRAVAALERAVELEADLTYSEPPPWYFPVRDALGRVLLEAGRSREAEAVYRKQLDATPDNGWTLYGLAASLRAQDRNDEQASVRKEFDAAWARADVRLTASTF